MNNKIRRFFQDERKVSKLISSTLIIGVALFTVGRGVFAYFYRTGAPTTGWRYGYGYGGVYGYGYGSADDSIALRAWRVINSLISNLIITVDSGSTALWGI